MPALALATTIAGFAAIVGLGALLRRVGILAAEDSKPLNAIIIYVGLPAFIFEAVHSAELSLDALSVVIVAWAVFAVTAALAWLAGRALRLQPATATALILVSALGNTGYIGYPLTAAVFGPQAVPSAVFYDIFGTVFALVLVGMPLAARTRREGPGSGRVNVLRELLTFPAVIALALALALNGVEIPEAVNNWLGILANMVAPLIMLSVGVALRPKAIVSGWTSVAAASVIRLAIAPAVAFAVAALVVSDQTTARVAVLEASVPSMMLTLAVGERFGLDTDFIASAIFVTTLLSAITIPVVQALLG